MKKQKNNPDAFFVLGIFLIGISPVFIATINKAIGLSFLALGLVYIGIGLRKNKKVKKR